MPDRDASGSQGYPEVDGTLALAYEKAVRERDEARAEAERLRARFEEAARRITRDLREPDKLLLEAYELRRIGEGIREV